MSESEPVAAGLDGRAIARRGAIRGLVLGTFLVAVVFAIRPFDPDWDFNALREVTHEGAKMPACSLQPDRAEARLILEAPWPLGHDQVLRPLLRRKYVPTEEGGSAVAPGQPSFS